MFAIILFGNIMLKFILILAIILFGSCETILFTCNNTCLILVNVHENHEQAMIGIRGGHAPFITFHLKMSH